VGEDAISGLDDMARPAWAPVPSRRGLGEIVCEAREDCSARVRVGGARSPGACAGYATAGASWANVVTGGGFVTGGTATISGSAPNAATPPGWDVTFSANNAEVTAYAICVADTIG